MERILNHFLHFNQHFSLFRSEKTNIPKTIYESELLIGNKANQEVVLQSPKDTRWCSHFKTFCNFKTLMNVYFKILSTSFDFILDLPCIKVYMFLIIQKGNYLTEWLSNLTLRHTLHLKKLPR